MAALQSALLPGVSKKTYRAAFFIGNGMDFGGSPAAAPADGFRTAPFLPLAERCALTIVLLMLFS